MGPDILPHLPAVLTAVNKCLAKKELKTVALDTLQVRYLFLLLTCRPLKRPAALRLRLLLNLKSPLIRQFTFEQQSVIFILKKASTS